MKERRIFQNIQKGQVDEQDIKNIIFDVCARRKPFRLTIYQLSCIYFGPFIALYNWMSCKKLRWLKTAAKENKLFRKAKRKYHEELDIIEILKKVRSGEHFRKMFLSN